MRSAERTPAKQARCRTTVRDIPYPVRAIWTADDPAMTLAVYGEKARAAPALPPPHCARQAFPREDQAAAIAQKIAELALLEQPGNPPS